MVNQLHVHNYVGTFTSVLGYSEYRDNNSGNFTLCNQLLTLSLEKKKTVIEIIHHSKSIGHCINFRVYYIVTIRVIELFFCG